MTRVRTACLAVLALVVVSLLFVGCSGGTSSGDWVGATPLAEALANGKPTIAEFGASTCIPCKAMKPILEEIVAEHGDKVNLSFTDIRIHTDVAADYRITLMPTQIFFDSAGQEVSRHVGFWAEEAVLAHLQELGFL